MTGPDPLPEDPGLRHAALDTVTAELRRLGARGSVRVLPDLARTAQQAADGLGCEVGAIANSLVFDAGGMPVLILTSGAHRVDTARVAAETGLPPLARATPAFVLRHTGQVIGGVAPLGHPEPLPTFLDRALAAHDVVWASAGHARAVFDTTYAELLALTGARELDVA